MTPMAPERGAAISVAMVSFLLSILLNKIAYGTFPNEVTTKLRNTNLDRGSNSGVL